MVFLIFQRSRSKNDENVHGDVSMSLIKKNENVSDSLDFQCFCIKNDETVNGFLVFNVFEQKKL